MSQTPQILRSLADTAAKDGRASEAANLNSCANHVERIEAEVERLTKVVESLTAERKVNK